MDNETNPTPANIPIQPTPPIDPGPKKSMNTWVALAGFVVIVGAAAAGALWLKQRTPTQNTQSPVVSPTPTPTNSTEEPLVSGLIDWHYPNKTFFDVLQRDAPGTSAGSETKFNDVGIFKSGNYKGAHLVVATFGCNELCVPSVVRFVAIEKDNKITLVALKNYSDPLDNIDTGVIDTTKYSVDTTMKIPDLDSPARISGSKPGVTLTRGNIDVGYRASYILFNATNLKPLFFDSKVGEVYTTPDDPKKVGDIFAWDGFYVKSPDWNTIVYTYTPNFVKTDGTIHITWDDGAKVIKQYVYTDRTGCGSSNYGSIVRDISVDKDLVKSGMTDTGDTLYEFKDKNHPYLKDIYDNVYYPYTTDKLPYNQFIAQHPVFFTVDPYGRLFRFANNDFQPQAECGKPVIYLYPTKTENVSVKLSPTGRFSYTEPDYGNGWNVLANPSGQVVNKADGKTYPYLFWEGRSSDIYQIPDQGFVVAQSSVHNLLNEKLTKLGLNAQETSDFEAYWEPYMQTAPYYFVTFMGNSVMDKIAPLEINPKPDTVIRILMDFKPLDKPIAIQGFDIKTPARKGFTVVEWGGVKH